MRASPILPIFAIGACALTAGCGLPVLDLRDAVDLHHTAIRDKLASRGALAREFLACAKQPYDERGPMSHTTDIPEAVASGKTPTSDGSHSDGHLAPIHALIERMKATRQPQAESLSVLKDLVGEFTSESRQHLDLGKLKHVVDVVRQWHAHFNFDEDKLSKDLSPFAQLLLAYNKAYFGDIAFAAKPAGSGLSVGAVTKTTSSGFTDRNGNTWIFPGLSVQIARDAEKPLGVAARPVDSQRISADLVRIFLEAFFDAVHREPAVHGATALQIDWKDSVRPYPEFDAAHAPIPLAALARITRDALRAEAAVTSMVGKAVRGGSVFGTNNETVAATLETAAGVIAKKIVEHEEFCYFQVTQGAAIEKEPSPTGPISSSAVTH